MANRNITITCEYGTPYIDGVAVSAGINVVADGSHIFSVKEFVTVSEVTYRCVGWSEGTGDFSETGTTFTETVTISQDGTITWTFKYLSRCPSCGESWELAQRDRIRAVENGSKAICFVCGYDNTGDPKFKET